MGEEEVRAMLYLIAFGKDAYGNDELYSKKIHTIKALVDRQQEEIKYQNETIRKLAAVIAEIAEIADLEKETMDILEKYL